MQGGGSPAYPLPPVPVPIHILITFFRRKIASGYTFCNPVFLPVPPKRGVPGIPPWPWVGGLTANPPHQNWELCSGAHVKNLLLTQTFRQWAIPGHPLNSIKGGRIRLKGGGGYPVTPPPPGRGGWHDFFRNGGGVSGIPPFQNQKTTKTLRGGIEPPRHFRTTGFPGLRPTARLPQQKVYPIGMPGIFLMVSLLPGPGSGPGAGFPVLFPVHFSALSPCRSLP
jgi:hypothetical protein